MQEITTLLKTLHELEFIVAYQKHLIACASSSSSSTTSQDRSSANLKEFYRVYLNIKNLTCVLRNGIWKLYAENCKLNDLNKAHNRHLAYTKKQHATRQLNVKIKKKPSCSSSLSMSNLHRYYNRNESREELIDLEFGAAGQKRPNDFLKKYQAKPVCISQHHLNYPHQSVLNQSKSQDVITIKNKPFHSSSSMSTHSLSSSTLSSSSSLSSTRSLAKSASSQALVHSSPITTTIAQAIEETEAALGLNKQIPFNYLHNKLNASRSEVKRENLNVDIDLTNICTSLEAKNDESSLLSSLRAQINTNENLVTNNYNMLNNKQYLISYPANNETISPSSTSNATTCSSISLSSFSLASKTRLMPLTAPLKQHTNYNNNGDNIINASGHESLNFFNFNSYVSKKAVKASPYFFNLNNEMTNLSTSQQQYDNNNASLLCNFATISNNNKNSNNGHTSNVVNKKLETNSSQAFFFNKV
jgi:hypothetical protein